MHLDIPGSGNTYMYFLSLNKEAYGFNNYNILDEEW